MSYNNNFDGHHFTFQNQNNFAPNFIPPPPIPPQLLLRPYHVPAPYISDQDFVKRFERPSSNNRVHLVDKNSTISKLKEKLQKVVHTLNTLKERERVLKDNINTLAEENWTATVLEVDELKKKMTETMSTINNTLVNDLLKSLAKRSAKRLRQKRVKKEQRQEHKQKVKDMQEKSRKINEHLQKIKDDIIKAKQEEESKRRADIVLKETLRKKTDAKRCIVKLDALMQLRKAKQNTAKGRGENLSESDTDTFNYNIEKLKALWTLKLAAYEKEEAESRAKLQDDVPTSAGEIERETLHNLSKWRQLLFGLDGLPQVDFKGDAWAFVNARQQWDRYLCPEGSALPIGWVTPKPETLVTGTT